LATTSENRFIGCGAKAGCFQTKKAAQSCLLIVPYARLFHAVLLAELLDATGGIDDLLLAGVERMTLRANFDVQGFAHGGTGGETVAATAIDGDFVVLRVNVGSHVVSLMNRAANQPYFRKPLIIHKKQPGCKALP
jgi:hypothetical protein